MSNHVLRIACVMTVLAVLGGILFTFSMCCMFELFVNLFTGGSFSLFFPLLMTLLVGLCVIALGLVAGGTR